MPRRPKRTQPSSRKQVAETAELSPRVARRERRRERSREEIVEAARRVILAKGIGGTTLEAIAKEVGLTKAALYYYYPSKDAVMFEIVYEALRTQSQAIHDAVEQAPSGGAALAAIIGETVRLFAGRLDDFRLAFLTGQVAGPEAVHVGAEQFARIRPLNDLAYAGATRRIQDDWKHKGKPRVEPRITAFLAGVAAIGLLTVKGAVENVGDPLLYSDEQLIDALSKIFAAAVEPPG